MFKEGTTVHDLFHGLDTGIEEKSVLETEPSKLFTNVVDLLSGELMVSERKLQKAQKDGDPERIEEFKVQNSVLEWALRQEIEMLLTDEAERVGPRTSEIIGYADVMAEEFLQAVVDGKVAENNPNLESAFNRIASMGALNVKIDTANTKNVLKIEAANIKAAEVFARAADKVGVLHQFKPYISKDLMKPDVASVFKDMDAPAMEKLCKPLLNLVTLNPAKKKKRANKL